MFEVHDRPVANLFWVTAVTVVAPIVLGMLLLGYAEIRLVSIPLHSVMEATGGIIAIVISMIFYIKYEKILVVTHFNWSTGALLAMGIIDIFHASVMPGNQFVWLHSTAVFFGGMFFVSVWLPERRVRSSVYRAIPLFFIIFSLLFGVLSLVFEAYLPAMLDDAGRFSDMANLLNIVGGAGFFIATIRFVMAYLRTKEREEILFAGHTMLFGTAGVLFVSSVVWDLQWWLWHLLRLLAYIVAFYVLYVEYRRDLHTLEQTNRKLEVAHHKIGEYLETVDKYVITSSTDARGIITEVSQAFCDISGYSKEELVGQSHNIVRHADMSRSLYRELWHTIRSGKAWYGEIKNRKKDGSSYWVDAVITPKVDAVGRIVGYTAVRQDITDKKRVEILSITDELSGLYNRRYFNDVIAKECGRATRDGRHVAFAIMDIDHFKQFNDTYGHQKGDEVIKAVGTLLRTHTRRSGDYAFRLGGEEFGVLFGVENAVLAQEYAEKIRTAVEALQIEHAANSAGTHVTMSIGVVLFGRERPQRCSALYSDADAQLYRAKEAGRNRVFMEEGTTADHLG